MLNNEEYLIKLRSEEQGLMYAQFLKDLIDAGNGTKEDLIQFRMLRNKIISALDQGSWKLSITIRELEIFGEIGDQLWDI